MELPAEPGMQTLVASITGDDGVVPLSNEPCMDPSIGIDSDRGGRFVESPGQSEHVFAAIQDSGSCG